MLFVRQSALVLALPPLDTAASQDGSNAQQLDIVTVTLYVALDRQENRRAHANTSI